MDKPIHETLIEQLNWRYAVKKFDPYKKISNKDWEILEEVLCLAPSSYGLQPFQFLVVQNQEIRKQLTAVSWGQMQIETCSHLVVLTHLKSVSEEYIANYIRRTSEVRGIPESELMNYQEGMVGDLVKGPRAAFVPQWAARQAYIAMGSFLTAAALLNVDVCPMEGIISAQYEEILGLKVSNYNVIAVLAAGYRAADDSLQHAKKVRLEKKDLIKIIE